MGLTGGSAVNSATQGRPMRAGLLSRQVLFADMPDASFPSQSQSHATQTRSAKLRCERCVLVPGASLSQNATQSLHPHKKMQQRAGCVREHAAGGARQPQGAKATAQLQPGAVAVRLQPCSCTLQVSAAEHGAAAARAKPAPRGRNLRAAASSGVLQRCVCSVAVCGSAALAQVQGCISIRL